MSDGREFLNDQERDILDGELLMERARATREMAQLAIVMSSQEPQTVSTIVATFRWQAEQLELGVADFEKIRLHAEALAQILGGAALRPPIDQPAEELALTQTIIDAIPATSPLIIEVAPEQSTATDVAAEQQTATFVEEEMARALQLDARSDRYIREIFGDYDELNLQEVDKAMLVEALLRLRGNGKRELRQDFAATYRMRLTLMLAGARNQAIADHEKSHTRTIENALYHFKAYIQENHSLDQAQAVLRTMLTKTEGAMMLVDAEMPDLSVLEDESLADPIIENTSAELAAEDGVESAAFERLQDKIRQLLASEGYELPEAVTLARMMDAIRSAHVAAAAGDSLLIGYIAYLRTDNAPRELSRQMGLSFNELGQLISYMPQRIAAVLVEQGVATKPSLQESPGVPLSKKASVPRVPTPGIMPARQQPLVYRKPQWSAEDHLNNQAILAANGTASMSHESVGAVALAPEQIPVVEVIQREQRVVDEDDRSHDEVRMTVLTLIKGLNDFSDNEKRALRLRAFFGNNRAHADVTGHTVAALRKVQDRMIDRGDALSLPSELAEQTLKHFVMGGQNDLDTIFKKLRRGFPEVEFEPQDVQRWLGLGLEAALVVS